MMIHTRQAPLSSGEAGNPESKTMTTQTLAASSSESTHAAVAELLASAKVTTVPFRLLVDTEANVNHNAPLMNIPELANNINLTGGVHQNLVVHLIKGKTKAEDRYGVAAGRRRQAALARLVAQGEITADYPVPVKLVSRQAALLISLSENAQREPMHPFREIKAFADLVQEGRSIEFIASVFGVSELTVRRRLKLASLSPKVLALLETDDITLEQLHALALTEDHALQERLWFDAQQTWLREPSRLREAITQSETEISRCALARFVGVEAYEAAGGTIRRDLFAEAHEGYITNIELLQTLAADKLQQQADALQAEGWKWVEVMPSGLDYSQRQRYGQLPRVLRELSAEEVAQQAAWQAQLDAVNTRIDELENNEDECEDDAAFEAACDQAYGEQEQLEDALNALEASRVLGPDKAQGGVIVYVDWRGDMQMLAGLMSPEDTTARLQQGQAVRNESGNPITSVQDKAKPIHSEKMVRRLSAHRTAAVQAELIARPAIALAVLAHRLLCSAFATGYHGERAVKISADSTEYELPRQADDLQPGKAWQAREAAHRAWQAKLPANFQHSLDWLVAWPQEDLLALLAYLTAISVNGIQTQEGDSPLDLLAEAVQLDMTQYWQPTRESYLDHVSKQRLQEVVAQAISAEAALPLASMKKGEAAAAAEALLAGKGWLPTLLGRQR
ncbi:hypothetical protein BUE93_20180 [Chromobacterium amazonense]|uniref:ParB-like N-terminal domain-containing protein n=2 Tax=Chromobacterium amazonense TaxID=1382803 RepID=A0A2S9WZ78_9NEIS|nr:hypothetical protein BUE93_20180 [Chromobacterium amazonense]